MGIIELFAALASTGIISIGVAHWLGKTLIERRLDRNAREHEASLSKMLKEHDALVNARLKKEVEAFLGEQSAERQYRMDARKRLYSAVGPLRFQLLMACAEYANRIARIGDGKYKYNMSMSGYFARSTLYRLIRTLAISELIERQIAYADFSIDPEIRALLRFKQQAFLCLSSHQVSLDHPNADWRQQSQHIFYDNLAMISSAMIINEPGGVARILRFDEFMDLANEEALARFAPLPELFTQFAPEHKPILWLRLIALAQLSIGFVKRHGQELDLPLSDFDVEMAIKQSRDPHATKRIDTYLEAIRNFRNSFTSQ